MVLKRIKRSIKPDAIQWSTKSVNRELWLEFKATLKCAKCGFSHPAAIDFHHIDSSTKDGEVNRLSGTGSYKKAYAEVEKCIPLCSNCHRIHHWDEGRA
jgi:hypothetical protein